MDGFSFDPRIAPLLGEIGWHLRPERLVLAEIDGSELPVVLRLLGGLTGQFWQVSVEPGAATLIIEESDWRRVSPAFPRAKVARFYRAISFAGALPADLVGFMAVLSAALAAAGIPLLAICTFAHDHLLVRESDSERAVEAIAALIERAREAA